MFHPRSPAVQRHRPQRVVAREDGDEMFSYHPPVDQVVRVCFSAHERRVEPASLQGVGELGEYWLDIVTSMLSSSSCRMRITSGNQSISVPRRNPRANAALAGCACGFRPQVFVRLIYETR